MQQVRKNANYRGISHNDDNGKKFSFNTIKLN